MGAVKANNNKDTYKATAVTFIVIGTLFLINKLLPFASIGLSWVMNIGLVMSLLGSLSGYLLPLALLIIGIILFWVSKR